jgi:basic membrane protein A
MRFPKITAAAVLPLVVLLSACGSPSGTSTTSKPAATSPSGGKSPTRVFTVGLVTDVGGLNDKSFNHLAYVGVKAAQSQYGITPKVVESTSQASYVPNLTHFAQQHANLVIAVGFLMANAVYQVAKEYPSEHFALIDSGPTNAKGQTANLPNVANLFFKEQESGYLVGVIAGLMEKNHVGKATHNIIGYMGGVSIPPVNRYIAGYVAGAKKVDPTVQVLGGYSQSFTDENAGKGIGLTQINKGADILFQVAGSSGLGYLAAAQEKNVYGIGVDANQGYLGSYVITSAVKKVNVAVEQTIRDLQTGHFTAGDHTFGLTQNATGFAPPSSVVPASIVSQAQAYAKKIKDGSVVPPTTIPAH